MKVSKKSKYRRETRAWIHFNCKQRSKSLVTSTTMISYSRSRVGYDKEIGSGLSWSRSGSDSWSWSMAFEMAWSLCMIRAIGES